MKIRRVRITVGPETYAGKMPLGVTVIAVDVETEQGKRYAYRESVVEDHFESLFDRCLKIAREEILAKMREEERIP